MVNYEFVPDALSSTDIKLNEIEETYLKKTKNFIMNVYHEIDGVRILKDQLTFTKTDQSANQMKQSIAVFKDNKCIGYLYAGGITKDKHRATTPRANLDLVIKKEDYMKYSYRGCSHDMIRYSDPSVILAWLEKSNSANPYTIWDYCNPSYECA